MKGTKFFILLIGMLGIFSGCAKKGTQEVSSDMQIIGPIHPTRTGMLPKGVVYKTNGDYNANVMVTVSADVSRLNSYPAPSDITSQSTPIVLEGGWLLDRRGGAGPNARFLTWTYQEYSSFPNAPSPEEIMAHIIPEARVTETMALPYTLSEAEANIQKVNQFLLDNQ